MFLFGLVRTYHRLFAIATQGLVRVLLWREFRVCDTRSRFGRRHTHALPVVRDAYDKGDLT